MAFVRNPVVYVPDLTNGRPIVDGKVYLLTAGTVPPTQDSAINPATLLTVTYVNEAGNTVEQPQPLYTSKGGCLYGSFPEEARQYMIAPQEYVFAAYDKIGRLQYSAETTASDYIETNALAAVDSTVLVGGVEARQIRLIDGIKNLIPQPNVVMQVKGFYVGSNIGGGQFYYDPMVSKSTHNGGTIIAPEALSAWDGSQASLAVYLDWSGVGDGCFVLKGYKKLNPDMFGANGGSDDSKAFSAMVAVAESKKCTSELTRNINTPNLNLVALSFFNLEGNGFEWAGLGSFGIGGFFKLRNVHAKNWVKSTYLAANTEYLEMVGNTVTDCQYGLQYTKFEGTTIGVNRYFDIFKIIFRNNNFFYTSSKVGFVYGFYCVHRLKGLAVASGNKFSPVVATGASAQIHLIRICNERFANMGVIRIFNNEIYGTSRPDVVNISDDQGYAIRGDARSLHIYRNYLEQCEDVVPIYGKGYVCIADSNEVYEHNFRGIQFKRLNSFSDENTIGPNDQTNTVRILNNKVKSSKDCLEQPLLAYFTDFAEIINNEIEEMSDSNNLTAALEVSNSSSLTGKSVLVSGNDFRVSGSASSRGIFILNNSGNVKVCDNHSYSKNSFALFFSGTMNGKACVSGNTLISDTSSALESAANGIELEVTDNPKIKTFNQCILRNKKYLLVDGNTFESTEARNDAILEVQCDNWFTSVVDNTFNITTGSIGQPVVWFKGVGAGGTLIAERNVVNNASALTTVAFFYLSGSSDPTPANVVSICRNESNGNVGRFIWDFPPLSIARLVIKDNHQLGAGNTNFYQKDASTTAQKVVEENNVFEGATYAFNGVRYIGTVSTNESNNITI